MQISKEKLAKMYEVMVKIRKFEEKVVDIFARGSMPGLAHLYVGEEAVAVGACFDLGRDDYISSTHRGHGHCIAKGGDVKRMMAEIFGKKTGYCKGKGGSMHIADLDIGILGATGIVGGGIPIAVGAALSAKLRKTHQVAVCFFGDGASNQGTFHESLNLASVKNLPVVFVCENNLYAISTSQSEAQAIENIAVRAASYNMPGTIADGNDVLDVYDKVAEAVERARKGEGPSLVECKTYRWRGHHEGDPKRGARYRSMNEVGEWEKKCPIAAFKKHLLNEGILKEAELKLIEDRIMREIEEAVEFADEGPFPASEEILEDLFT